MRHFETKYPNGIIVYANISSNDDVHCYVISFISLLFFCYYY